MGRKKYQLQDSICYLVHRASRMLRIYLNKEFIQRGYNVTVEQFDVLVCLLEQDGQHQKQIADALCKDKTTITRLVSSIEKLNLVTRKTNPRDERQKLVCLTDTGRRVMKDLSVIAQRAMVKAQNGIAREDMDVCKDTLRLIHTTLSKELI